MIVLIQKKNCKLGFTLIELLVCIAITSILLAILFPVFSAAREKVRQTTCASNLYQIGIANSLYMQDYDERLPYCVSQWVHVHKGLWQDYPKVPNIGEVGVFQELLFPYVKNREVYRCPSDWGRPGATITVYQRDGISYNYDETACLSGWGMARIVKPSEFNFVFDAEDDWHTYRGADIWETRGNLLYLDNHVKFGQYHVPEEWR